MTKACTFQFHTPGIIPRLHDFPDLFCSELSIRQIPEFLDLGLYATGGFSGFLNEGGHHALDRNLREVPQARELEEGHLITINNVLHPLDALMSRFNPHLRPVGSVVPGL
ncbi:MAG: hypothetical protein MK312_07890, partial [Roseibacillus sp.]|nr:hypothetical protein [Roseibacillus sp.]